VHKTFSAMFSQHSMTDRNHCTGGSCDDICSISYDMHENLILGHNDSSADLDPNMSTKMPTKSQIIESPLMLAHCWENILNNIFLCHLRILWPQLSKKYDFCLFLVSYHFDKNGLFFIFFSNVRVKKVTRFMFKKTLKIINTVK